MSKISVTTIAGLTSGGDANTVKIESGDAFNVVSGATTLGGDLAVDTNVLKVDSSNNRIGINTTSPSDDFELTPSADGKGITLKTSSNIRPYLNLDANRSGAGNNLAQINFKWDGTDVARIIAVAGADTTNKDDAHLTFSTASAGSPTEAMRIDSAGRITKPLQPSFHAYLGTNQTGYNANSLGNHYIQYDTDVYDIGNNHSNGIFTAPIAGVYYFRAEAYTNAYCTQAWFIVNGSRAVASDAVYTGDDSFSGNSVILKLAANDTVGFHPYRSGNSSMTVNTNQNHTWFRGMLLG